MMFRLIALGLFGSAVLQGAVTHAQISAAPAPVPARVSVCPLTGAYDRSNVFARIIRGELPASVVAQDAEVIALIPLGWDHPGHVLVVPKRPARNFLDLDDAQVVAVTHMIKRVAVAQQRALGATGFKVQQNNAFGQDVCHAHFHIIPDTAELPNHHASRDEMDAIAGRLRAALPARR